MEERPEKQLIEQMLAFLDSASEIEESDELCEEECSSEANDNGSDGTPEDNQSRDKKTEGELRLNLPSENDAAGPNVSADENAEDNEICGYPVWKTKKIEPLWRVNSVQTEVKNDYSSASRHSNRVYMQEVQRAIYGDVGGHPDFGSTDYYQAAQNYAIFGKEFLDFPSSLYPLFMEKEASTTDGLIFENLGTTDSGIYPSVATGTGAEFASHLGGIPNYNKQVAAGSIAASATYYQVFNSLQQSARPTAANTAYGIFMGNKYTYMTAGQPTPSLILNQHTSTTTNFISNNLANAALTTSPHLLHSNPVLTTITQQCLNTLFKDAQHMSSTSTQSTTIGTTAGIYERLMYAHILQQHILHQMQQAAFVSAMYQHQVRAARAINSPAGVAAINASMAASAAAAQALRVKAGLHLCGRQTGGPFKSIESPTKPAITINPDDIVTTLHN